MYGSIDQFTLKSKFSNNELNEILGNKPNNNSNDELKNNNYFDDQGFLVHIVRGDETLEGLSIAYNVKVNKLI